LDESHKKHRDDDLSFYNHIVVDNDIFLQRGEDRYGEQMTGAEFVEYIRARVKYSSVLSTLTCRV